MVQISTIPPQKKWYCSVFTLYFNAGEKGTFSDAVVLCGKWSKQIIQSNGL